MTKPAGLVDLCCRREMLGHSQAPWAQEPASMLPLIWSHWDWSLRKENSMWVLSGGLFQGRCPAEGFSVVTEFPSSQEPTIQCTDCSKVGEWPSPGRRSAWDFSYGFWEARGALEICSESDLERQLPPIHHSLITKFMASVMWFLAEAENSIIFKKIFLQVQNTIML